MTSFIDECFAASGGLPEMSRADAYRADKLIDAALTYVAGTVGPNPWEDVKIGNPLLGKEMHDMPDEAVKADPYNCSFIAPRADLIIASNRNTLAKYMARLFHCENNAEGGRVEQDQLYIRTTINHEPYHAAAAKIVGFGRIYYQMHVFLDQWPGYSEPIVNCIPQTIPCQPLTSITKLGHASIAAAPESLSPGDKSLLIDAGYDGTIEQIDRKVARYNATNPQNVLPRNGRHWNPWSYGNIPD